MRVVLADLKSNRGFVSKDTVVGGYGSRLDPFSRVTAVISYLKKQFHDDFRVPAIAPQELGTRFLNQIRYALRRLEQTQSAQLTEAGKRIAVEIDP